MSEDIIKDILNSKVGEKTYDDLAHPITNSVGEFIARPFKLLNSLCLKTDLLIEQRAIVYKEIVKRFEKYVATIPDKKLTEGRLSISEPIINQLAVNIGERELSDMFMSMLEKSMTVEECDFVHPALIKIVEQMSNLDAQLLKRIFNENGLISVMEFYFCKTNKTEYLGFVENYSGYQIVHNAIYYTDESNYPLVQFSINNLERLGLISINFELQNDASNYCKIVEHFKFDIDEIISKYINKPEYLDFSIQNKKGVIKLTSIGKSLCKICFD